MIDLGIAFHCYHHSLESRFLNLPLRSSRLSGIAAPHVPTPAPTTTTTLCAPPAPSLFHSASMLSRAHASRPPDSILKYVIVGDAAVGKSCLLVRLTDDKFANAEPTLGVEFGSKILTVGDEGKRVKVQCK